MTPEATPLDIERILRTLRDHGVACVVVGGVGAQIHGATRQTEDVDVVVDFDRDNLIRLATAMRELNARTRTGGYLDPATVEASKALVHEGFFPTMEVSTWMTDAGPLDILRNIPAVNGDRIDFASLTRRARDVVFGSVTVVVASLDDIVQSKKWADRPKDHDALSELHDLQRVSDDDRSAKPD